MIEMDLHLVYRALRKISDWSLDGYYSDLCIIGKENVPKDAPLLLASSHANEIMDIATLAVTIPYRRHVSFWAKSSMFKTWLPRQIMLSSGAIPVQRSPDKVTSSSTSSQEPSSTQAALFASSIDALSQGNALGVFPEGTSSTEPSIQMLRDGASYAALQYVSWRNGEKESGKENRKTKEGIVIVPVGIIYTDKMRYQSRVLVKWGKPIVPKLDNSEDRATNAKVLTLEIEQALFSCTINAQDWDTIWAAHMARDILWRGDHIPLPRYLETMQSFCELFQQPSTCRTALCSYAGFLQRISTTHESLQWLLPSSPTPSLPSIPRTTWLALITSLRTFLHPGTVFFLPVALVHMPAYALGLAASRFLAPRGEHESVVQFRVIVGGIGAAISYSTTLLKLASWLGTFASSSKQAWGEVVVRRILGKMENDWGQSGTVDLVERLGRVLSGGEGSTKRVLVAIGFAYIGTWALAKWHAALVTGFVKRRDRLLASWELLAASFVKQVKFTEDERRDVRPLLPKHNPLAKARYNATAPQVLSTAMKGASGPSLMLASLQSRADAETQLKTFLSSISTSPGDSDNLVVLKSTLRAVTL